MKPKPFASLNHFTVPVAMSLFLSERLALLVLRPAWSGVVSLNSLPRHRLAEMPLDRAQLLAFFGRGEARRAPACLGTRGAADAVDVILYRVRQVEVDDVCDVGHVDAARSDVGGDQHAVAAGAESVEGFAPLRHRAIGVQPRHL